MAFRAFVICWFWSFSFFAQAEKVIHFAPLPMENPRLSVIKSQAFTSALSKLLKQPVKTKFYASYDEILNAFINQEVDLIELGPFNYLKLKEMTSKHAPLAMIRQFEGQQNYQCYFVSPVDGLKSVTDFAAMKSMRIGMTQPLSTCGWFGTDYFFRQSGKKIADYPFQFVGSHEGVALSLVRYEFDVGSVASFIGDRYQPLGLNVLDKSPLLPLFSIVANPESLTKAQTDRISLFLTQLTLDDTQGWKLGRYGFIPFAHESFENFERMAAEMTPMPKQGGQSE